MAQHEVEIKDSNGNTVTLEVTVPPVGDSTWRVKHHRFLRLQDGVADRGADPGSQGEWLSCYGGPQVNDDLLVFHLDGFFSGERANQSGSGKLYDHDNLIMLPGALTWRLLWSV